MAPGYFDTFSRAFVSMFRITIGSVDWWYDIFPIVESDGSISVRASAFLISYVIVVNWFFFQITIAVLLENCQDASRVEEEKRKSDEIQRKQREKALKNPLDPLLLELSMDFVSDVDLKHHLNGLFTVCPRSQARKRMAISLGWETILYSGDNGSKCYLIQDLSRCLLQRLVACIQLRGFFISSIEFILLSLGV